MVVDLAVSGCIGLVLSEQLTDVQRPQAQAIAVFSNLTISGASSGIPAYLPTGTADPSGISAASNAPALISSFTAEGGASATSIDAGNATLTSQTTTTATAFPGATEGTVAGESASTGTEASTGTDASSAESSAADTAAATDTAAASSAAATTTA